MNTRSLPLALALVVALSGCAKKNEATASAPAPSASASVAATASAARKQEWSLSPAVTATAAPSEPEEDPSWPALSGEKPLRERLVGKWEPRHPPKLDARIKEEFNRADDRINSAPTPSDRKAAQVAKVVLEEITSTSLEFTQAERIARTGAGKVRSQRPYEVVSEKSRTLTLRVREKGKDSASGELEQYTFRDDDTVSTERDEVDDLDVFVRSKAKR